MNDQLLAISYSRSYLEWWKAAGGAEDYKENACSLHDNNSNTSRGQAGAPAAGQWQQVVKTLYIRDIRNQTDAPGVPNSNASFHQQLTAAIEEGSV